MFTHQTIQGIKYSSLTPVLFNKKWAVKASATSHGICLVIFNTTTYDTIVKFFDDEDQAHAFIIDTVSVS